MLSDNVLRGTDGKSGDLDKVAVVGDESDSLGNLRGNEAIGKLNAGLFPHHESTPSITPIHKGHISHGNNLFKAILYANIRKFVYAIENK